MQHVKHTQSHEELPVHEDTLSPTTPHAWHASLRHRTQMKFVASLLLKDVPGYRVRDSSFWTLAYRQLVHARPDNGPQHLYERLLPYLNARPLLSNVPAGISSEASCCAGGGSRCGRRDDVV